MRHRVLLFLLACTPLLWSQAQFDVQLEPLQVTNFGGLQSFAHASWEGKWFLFGGRLDGLHQRQPWASFDAAGHNDQIWIIQAEQGQAQALPTSGLAAPLRDQLKSTNMEFYQRDSLLYLVGGYGISSRAGGHLTFDRLTIVNLAALNRYHQGQNPSLASCFTSTTDSRFAVTGGSLQYGNGSFYLAGGQKFDGRYNPMGGPSFTQQYTNAVRRFAVQQPLSNTPQVSWESPFQNAQLMHRRDYNVLPQVDAQGKLHWVAYSGVFQTSADLPFLDAVRFDSTGLQPIPNFSQYYNHYHCATVPLYDPNTGAMHSIFFGGIAQYFQDASGQLVQDNDVPFVKTIGLVSRDSSGTYTEYKLPTEMPGYLGAGSEFFRLDSLPTWGDQRILKVDLPLRDTLTIGYVLGGISSSAPNIFFSNTGSQSQATAQLFRVSLVPSSGLRTPRFNPQSRDATRLQVFPNPGQDRLRLQFQAPSGKDFQLRLYSAAGKLVHKQAGQTSHAGQQEVELEVNNLKPGRYSLGLELQGKVSRQAVVINPSQKGGQHH